MEARRYQIALCLCAVTKFASTRTSILYASVAVVAEPRFRYLQLGRWFCESVLAIDSGSEWKCLLWPSTQDCFCVARGLGLFGILSRVGRIPLVLMSRIQVWECMGGRQSNADKLCCLVQRNPVHSAFVFSMFGLGVTNRAWFRKTTKEAAIPLLPLLSYPLMVCDLFGTLGRLGVSAVRRIDHGLFGVDALRIDNRIRLNGSKFQEPLSVGPAGTPETGSGRWGAVLNVLNYSTIALGVPAGL